MTTTTTNALPVASEAHEEWSTRSSNASTRSSNPYTRVRVEVEGILEGVDDALMTRVLRRRGWYLVPNVSTYPTLRAYIDASYAALAADVRAYQAEVAAAEAAHRKRRRAELKAERAAEPPAPERAQPTRASKRARGSA
jgi:hypothetical protein